MTKISNICASMTLTEEDQSPFDISIGEPIRSQQGTPREEYNSLNLSALNQSSTPNYNFTVVVINTVNEDPNVINMKLQLDTEEEQIEIDFDYNLKHDKPDVVANEMCHEMNLASSAFNDIRELIQQQGKYKNKHSKSKFI